MELNNNYNRQNFNNNKQTQKSYKNNLLISVFESNNNRNMNNNLNNFGNQNMNYNNFKNQNMKKNNNFNINNYNNIRKFNNYNNKNIIINNNSNKNHIKQSIFKSEEIDLMLISKQLKIKSKRSVQINKKLSLIIQEYKNNEKWINKYPIKTIQINGKQLNINETLAEQNIMENTTAEIIFNIQ